MEEITIKLTSASRISQKCERVLCGRGRDRVRARMRDLRAAGALLRERKVVADLQDVYYDEAATVGGSLPQAQRFCSLVGQAQDRAGQDAVGSYHDTKGHRPERRQPAQDWQLRGPARLVRRALDVHDAQRSRDRGQAQRRAEKPERQQPEVPAWAPRGRPGETAKESR